ncbi:MAG: ABC transporter permease, partial [Caulobacteraceae bacterium]
AAALGVGLAWRPLQIVGVTALVILSSALFSTFSLIIACLVKTRERFMGIGQFLTMPIFFASNAIYPIAVMPAWLRAISRANPLSYEVDGLRALMLRGGHSQFGLPLDFVVLGVVVSSLIVVATRMYPRLTQ